MRGIEWVGLFPGVLWKKAKAAMGECFLKFFGKPNMSSI